MKKSYIVVAIIVLVLIIGAISLYSKVSTTQVASVPAVTTTAPSSNTASQTTTTTTVTSATLPYPLMQSTGQQFAQSTDAPQSHEIYPVLASDTVKTMGAFSYKTTDLGSNEYKITLLNSSEGYTAQSVIVTTGQKVYFYEKATGDDSASEDSVTTDDKLIAVDASGNILK
jgi:hypothetical protein